MFSALEGRGVTDADTPVLQWDECRAPGSPAGALVS
jgi:hypothetical protein